MSDAITARQTQVLKSLINEYIDTAEPVGSDNLDKKYDLGVSPATIRNEMVTLTKSGFLKQPHTSAGRVPTPKAMKFYIDQLMDEKKMSVTDEVKAKEEVWDARGNLDELLAEATHALAQRTHNLAVGAIHDGKVWHSGYANVFDNPEFADIRVCTSLFELLEEARRLDELLFERVTGDSPIEVVFGEDLGWSGLSPISVVATNFPLRGRQVALGVIGPTRISYPTVIPVLRYFGNLMQEIGGE